MKKSALLLTKLMEFELPFKNCSNASRKPHEIVPGENDDEVPILKGKAGRNHRLGILQAHRGSLTQSVRSASPHGERSVEEAS